jgi:hypothetical protein
MADRVIIPIAGLGTLVLDFEVYQAALQPFVAPSFQVKPDQGLLVDAAKLGELTSTAASWWEAAARNSDCPSIFVGKCRRFSVADCLSWLASVQERDETGRVRRCGAAPRSDM